MFEMCLVSCALHCVKPLIQSGEEEDGPGTSRNGPERPKSVPSASHERPRAPQERSKSVPRASQERPRAPQERPRTPPEQHKGAQSRLRDPSGRHFEASRLEKTTFEDDASRDSVEKRIWNDFRSIFTSCAQEQTCEKTQKITGFL